MPNQRVTLAGVKNGATLARLAVGNLPKSLKGIETKIRVYRRELENLVIEVKGEVSPDDAHVIDLAATAELHSHICRKLLRDKWDDMTIRDIETCSASIVKHKERRNRAVAQLGLKKPDDNQWDGVFDGTATEVEDVSD